MSNIPYEEIRRIATRVHTVSRDDLPVARGGLMIELKRDWRAEELEKLRAMMPDIAWGWCDAGDFVNV